MNTNYAILIGDNLEQIYRDSDGLDKRLPALKRGKQFHFRAFGEECCLDPVGVTFSEDPDSGPRALLVTLYALHASREPLRLEPYKAFKDLPNTAPYHGAFAANSERILVPHVPEMERRKERICKIFGGIGNPKGISGDLTFLLYPLPKIGLLYIVYLADDEFPSSVTCLFSSNALSFMPIDGLADVAEYTAREIIRLCGKEL